MTEHGILNKIETVKFWLVTWKQLQTSGKTVSSCQLVKGDLPYPLMEQMKSYNAKLGMNTHSYEYYDLSAQFRKSALQLVELNKPVEIDDPTD